METSYFPDEEGKYHFRTLRQFLVFFEGYVMISIFIIGAFGNILSLVVFLRSKRNDASCLYLSALAVSDTCCIVFIALVMWLRQGLPNITDGKAYINFYQISNLSCKLMTYVYVVFETVSAWIIVTYSVERAVIVWFPLKRTLITTRRRRIVLTFVILSCFCVALYSAILSDIFTVNNATICYYPQAGVVRFVLLLSDNFLFYFLPCTMIIVANIAIVTGIVRSRRFQNVSSSNTKDIYEKKTLANLLVVSTFYIIFMTPNTVMIVYYFSLSGAGSDHMQLILFVAMFAQQFCNFNYCINFIIYGISLPFYRSEVMKLCML
jgi:hypothetical protein